MQQFPFFPPAVSQDFTSVSEDGSKFLECSVYLMLHVYIWIEFIIKPKPNNHEPFDHFQGCRLHLKLLATVPSTF